MTPLLPSSRSLLFTATDRRCPRLFASTLRIAFAATASHTSPLSPHSVPRFLAPPSPLARRPYSSPPSHRSTLPIPLFGSRWSKCFGAMVPSAGSPYSLILPVTDNFGSIYTDTSSSTFSTVISLLLIPSQVSLAPHPLPLNNAPPTRKASSFLLYLSIQPPLTHLCSFASDFSYFLSVAMRFCLFFLDSRMD